MLRIKYAGNVILQKIMPLNQVTEATRLRSEYVKAQAPLILCCEEVFCIDSLKLGQLWVTSRWMFWSARFILLVYSFSSSTIMSSQFKVLFSALFFHVVGNRFFLIACGLLERRWLVVGSIFCIEFNRKSKYRKSRGY